MIINHHTVKRQVCIDFYYLFLIFSLLLIILCQGKSGYNNLQDQGFSQNMIENFAVKPSPTNLADLKKSSTSLHSKGNVSTNF